MCNVDKDVNLGKQGRKSAANWTNNHSVVVYAGENDA